MYDPTDPVQVAERKKKDRLDRIQYEVDLKDILGTPGGQRVFRELIGRGNIFKSSFTGNSKTYYLDGWRDLSLTILNDVTAVGTDEQIMKILIQRKGEENART